jgi:hypothetical protein
MGQPPGHPGCRKAVQLSRRTMPGGIWLGLAAVAVAPSALAARDDYEAMLLNCIDPRLTTYTWQYMSGRGLQNL